METEQTHNLSSKPDPRLTVLLVEDDANDVELLRLAFNSASGPEIEVAFDGREGVDIMQTLVREGRCPNLILCDLNMPVMNGFEFLKWLKCESPCPHTPLVVLTSSVVDTDILRAYEGGAAAYLVKPSTHEELQSLAKALVNFWALVQTSKPGSK